MSFLFLGANFFYLAHFQRGSVFSLYHDNKVFKGSLYTLASTLIQGCKFSDFSLISDFFHFDASENYFRNFIFGAHFTGFPIHSEFQKITVLFQTFSLNPTYIPDN